MSEKDEASKRQRQSTVIDATSLLRETEEQKEEIKNLKKILKLTKEQLDTSLAEKVTLINCVKDLVKNQQKLSDQLINIQQILQAILSNQNKHEHTLESVKSTNTKQAEEVKEQLRHQQQQQQQQQQQVKQQLQKQANEWVQVVRKTSKNDVDLQKSTKSTSTTSKIDEKIKAKTVKINRRILITRSSLTADRASTLAVRNAVNSALTNSGAPRNAAVIAVNYNEKDTIILTIREDCAAEVVLKY